MTRSASPHRAKARDAGLGTDQNLLVDPQGRRLDYLRLAVTEQCNLRCRYCMPEEGLDPQGKDDLLGFSELLRLSAVLCSVGVRRIRITGGEPLLRRGVPQFMREVASLPQQPEILLTTNGVLLEDQLADLVAGGLKRVNLSLDSLDPDTWSRITRRQGFAKVRRTIDAVLTAGLGLKINMVVLPGVNDHELDDFALLTRDLPLTVRFIEAMGFDGSGQPVKTMSGEEILERLQRGYHLEDLPRTRSAVAREYSVRGHKGHIGIIAGHSRSFCADCSRLRIGAGGKLRTCLYGNPAADLGPALRRGAPAQDILALIRLALDRRHTDGFAAAASTLQSMASIGG